MRAGLRWLAYVGALFVASWAVLLGLFYLAVYVSVWLSLGIIAGFVLLATWNPWQQRAPTYERTPGGLRRRVESRRRVGP